MITLVRKTVKARAIKLEAATLFQIVELLLSYSSEYPTFMITRASDPTKFRLVLGSLLRDRGVDEGGWIVFDDQAGIVLLEDDEALAERYEAVANLPKPETPAKDG